jgi:predicted DNA-binding transcriptional regulator AlpA
MSNNVFLTETEFCQRFGVSPRTAERWRSSGDGPPFVRFGRRFVRYKLSDVERWADSRTFKHRADELSRGLGA